MHHVLSLSCVSVGRMQDLVAPAAKARVPGGIRTSLGHTSGSPLQTETTGCGFDPCSCSRDVFFARLGQAAWLLYG
jgi:hypothetical protein